MLTTNSSHIRDVMVFHLELNRRYVSSRSLWYECSASEVCYEKALQWPCSWHFRGCIEVVGKGVFLFMKTKYKHDIGDESLFWYTYLNGDMVYNYKLNS